MQYDHRQLPRRYRAGLSGSQASGRLWNVLILNHCHRPFGWFPYAGTRQQKIDYASSAWGSVCMFSSTPTLNVIAHAPINLDTLAAVEI